MTETRELVRLLGSKFIQRRDVKAFQQDDGAWYPDRTPFTMQDFEAHLAGTRTLGHYMLDPEGNCKLFAFDLDLVKHNRECPGGTCTGCDVTFPNLVPDGQDNPQATDFPFVGIPREMYKADNAALRSLKIQLRCMAEGLAYRVSQHGIPVAIATSGHKGLHVYGFTGCVPAEVAKSVAIGVLEDFGCFEPFKGQNFWRHKSSYHVLDIEVFPKQDNLNGKDLGNLMKLPLGVHRVTKNRSTFLSTSSSYDRFITMDPERVLSGDYPWE